MSNTTAVDPTTVPDPTTEPTTEPTVPPTSTTTEPTITSTTSIPPTSTTTIPESTTSETTPTTTVAPVTSTIIQTPTDPAQEPTTQIIVETSTFTPPTEPTTSATSSSESSASATPSTLSAGDRAGGSSSGLGTSGTIAIAVVIPIVAIAGLLLLGFWLWRKRKARKSAEEMRKSEMAEYGFNPNNDPSLAPAGASYQEDQSEMTEDNSGYRGWGATTSNRKTSRTLGSSQPGMSDNGSQPGGYYPSPNAYSDAYSADPLVGGHPEGNDGVGALGAGAAGAAGAAGGAATAGLARNRSQGQGGVRRGPSNASSAYSNVAPSEASSDAPSMPRPYYEQEMYNEFSQPQHGPYGDGSYGGDQPVVRDVQARRNTRIERAPTFPKQQGGIAQNF